MTYCKMCNKEFIPKNSRNIYCCKECGELAKKINARKEIQTKICIICNKEFKTSRSFQKFCSNECWKKYKIEYDKVRNKNNIEKRKELSHKYYEENKNKIKEYSKKWFEENKEYALKKHNEGKRRRRKENPEKYREKDRIYNKNKSNEIKQRERGKRKLRWNNDYNYRLKNIISHQIRCNLFQNKTFKTFELLNYSIQDLKNHLESLFQEGMNWNNYGYTGWHIDHIKPVASFNLINKDGSQNLEEIKKCWALENLQPLWAKDNMSKGAWYIDEFGNKKQYRYDKK